MKSTGKKQIKQIPGFEGFGLSKMTFFGDSTLTPWMVPLAPEFSGELALSGDGE